MSESKYSSFSRDVIHGYEKVLASIFIKLYVDLYKWLGKSFSIHEDYIDLDKDLAFEADGMDLIEAAKLFRLNIFSHKILDKYSKGRKFSIENAKSAITNTRFQVRTEKQTLINSMNMTKPYSFNVLAMEEIGRISREIIQIRHMLSHNNNMTQSTQALILMGNLARLMSITPNEIRSSTPRFQELDEFIKNNLFNSIIEVYKPDVFISNQDEEEDANDEINISEKIEQVLNRLDVLNELKIQIANNNSSIESTQKSINDLSERYSKESSEVSQTLKEAVDPSRIRNLFKDQEIQSIDPILTEDIEEITEEQIVQDQDIVDINDHEKEISIEMPHENKQTKVSAHKKSKIAVGDLEFIYQDYTDAINDGIDKKLVFMWAVSDMQKDVSLTEDELRFVKDAVDSGAIDEEIYSNYIQDNAVEEKLLTIDELKDSLVSLRLEIIDHMKPIYPEFKNWHNILMNVLANQIIDEKISSEEDFRRLMMFDHYYNSRQVGSRMKDSWTEEEFEKIKSDAKEYIDYQMKEFWPRINDLVSRYSQ
jgi:hypothetical protein